MSKKYLDLEGLSTYDQKIKEYIGNGDDAVEEQVTDLKSANDYLTENNIQETIAYGIYDKSTNAGMTVEAAGNTITISGTSSATSAQVATKISITDHVEIWNASTPPSEAQVYPISLVSGHTYSLTVVKKSGTIDKGSGTGYVTVRIYDNTETLMAECQMTESNLYSDSVTFTAREYPILLRMLVARLATLTGAVFSVVLRDITEEKIDGKINEVADAYTGNTWLDFKVGRYKTPTTTGIGETVTRDDSPLYVSTICPCAEGDIFTVRIAGPSGTSRAYFFCDANMTALTRASANENIDGRLKAPAGSAYVVFNDQLSRRDSGYYAFKGYSVDYRLDKVEDASAANTEYANNGIYMYEMSNLSSDIVNGGSVTSNGIAFTYVSGNRKKITVSLSGTATDNAFTNLVTGSSTVSGKLWFRVEKEDNDGVYVKSTAGSTHITSSRYYNAPSDGVLRLYVAEGVTLDNYIVTVAIQSAPGNDELEYMMSCDDDDFAIPAYYETNDYLKNKITGILERSLSISGDSFIFITDYHAHKNAGHSLPIISKIHREAGISKLFCGGDVGTSTGIGGTKTNAKAISEFQEVAPNLYAVVGNHEWKVSDSSTTAATFNYVYNYYINQMESQTSGMSGFGDYWIDSKVPKIRYFFLNQNITAILPDISLKWFMSELPNVPEGYGVVVVMHHAYHSKTYNTEGSRDHLGMLNWWDNEVGWRNLTVRRIQQILNAIKTGETVKYALRPYDSTRDPGRNVTPRDCTTAEKNSCGNYDPILSTFEAGTDTGAYTDIVTFDGSSVHTGVYPIAIFCGHKHEDAANDPATAESYSDMTDENTIYLLNGTWYRYKNTVSDNNHRVAMENAAGAPEGMTQTEQLPPILTILTTTDCYALDQSDRDPTGSAPYVRTLGTINEQAFDVVQIDTAGRKVYCTRIGAGSDRVFSF